MSMLQGVLSKLGIEFCPICDDRLQPAFYKDEVWIECRKSNHCFKRWKGSMDYYQYYLDEHSYTFITDGQYDPVFVAVRIDEQENIQSSHPSVAFTFEELDFDPKNPTKAIEKVELLETFG